MIFLPEFNVTATSNVKSSYSKTFQALRTDTAFLVTNQGYNLERAILPQDATLVGLNVYTAVGSNAGTSATLSLGALLPSCTITAAGTTATVTTTVAHNLATGDTIVVNGSGQANFDQAAPVAITVTGVTTFTYTISSTTATATGVSVGVTNYFMKPISVLNGNQVTIAVGGSPFAYTAPTVGVVVVAGGTVSAITITHLGGSPVNIGVVAGPIPVITGDIVTVTYTGAPTMTFIPAEKSAVGQLPLILRHAGPVNVGFKTYNLLDLTGPTNAYDVSVFVFYQETGSASTTGGPWYFTMDYVR